MSQMYCFEEAGFETYQTDDVGFRLMVDTEVAPETESKSAV